MSMINFSHIKYYPIYKITDENNNDNVVGPSMIRIKKDNWQDILNIS